MLIEVFKLPWPRINVLSLDISEEMDGLMQRDRDKSYSRVVSIAELSEQVADYPLT